MELVCFCTKFDRRALRRLDRRARLDDRLLLAESDIRSMLNRFYRITLVVAAAAIGGLSLYWIVPDLTPYVGENGAALWSWFLIIASGVGAHRLLPRANLSHVSHVLSAILVSACVAMVIAWILMLVVDFPVDQGRIPQLLLVGFSALVLAGIVFFPIYLIQRKLDRSIAFFYFLAGILIPASCVLIYAPFGNDDIQANVLAAIVLGFLGACSAVGFAAVAGRSRVEAIDAA